MIIINEYLFILKRIKFKKERGKYSIYYSGRE
jgi:hypothetical protein